MWHGSVMDGIRLVAASVDAPRARRAAMLGQRAASGAAAQRPSMMIKTTGMRFGMWINLVRDGWKTGSV
jgi:hypothetical protein